MCGRQSEPLLKNLCCRARKRAYRHTADLSDMSDISGVADERVVQKYGLQQQVLRHVTLAAVGVIVYYDIAGVEALYTHLLDTERHGMKACTDNCRIHLRLANHAKTPVE